MFTLLVCGQILLGALSAKAQVEGLLELARARFGELSSADESLYRSVALGEIAKYEEGASFSASHIVWLCTDPRASKYVSHRGLRVYRRPNVGEAQHLGVRLGFDHDGVGG